MLTAKPLNAVILLSILNAGWASGMHTSNLEVILHDSNSFRKGREAEPTYDIFKRRDGDYPFWITAAASLEEAKERIAGYALVVPGEYFIYSRGKELFLSASPRRKDAYGATDPSGCGHNLGITRSAGKLRRALW
jgi:hypothetical protein